MAQAAAWFDFDINGDPVFETAIRPFIEAQMAEMAAYDWRRQALNPDIEYIFHEHAKRAADNVRALSARLGQPKHVQDAMWWAMLPHDIFKKEMPIELWDLPGKPTKEQKEITRTHAPRGVEIVRAKLAGIDHPFIGLMTDIMAHHHETMTGTGPCGLSADKISDPVRVCAIVEAYDGHMTFRPGQEKRRTPAEALEKMRSDPDKGAALYDMDFFEAFAAMILDNHSNQEGRP